MTKRFLSFAIIFSMLTAFAALSAFAQEGTAVTNQSVSAAQVSPVAQTNTNQPATVAPNTAAVQPQYYYRPTTVRDFFGFDGIPFNGSHRAAFLRWRSARGGF